MLLPVNFYGPNSYLNGKKKKRCKMCVIIKFCHVNDKGTIFVLFLLFNFSSHQILTYVYSLPPSLAFFSLSFFIFKDVCLVLASHNGNGWKRWNWWSLSSMSCTLWQRKDCGDGSKLWKVVRVLVRFCGHFVLYNLISCWVTS